MTERIGRTNLKILARALLLVALAVGYGSAQERGTLSEFRDEEFGYRFLYPAEWKLDSLPEGEANPGMRVRLRGASGKLVRCDHRTNRPTAIQA